MRHFLLLGQTGVGKSSFVNATFGRELADTDGFEPCTKLVEQYAYGTEYGDVCLLDTPGLSEDSSSMDRKYLDMVRRAIDKVAADLMTLYISPVTENRLRSSEMSALRAISNELGHSIWRHSWLILTFAASIPHSRLERAIESRTQQISGYIWDIVRSEENYRGFSAIGVIDNVVPDWTPDAVGVGAFLNNEG